MKKCIVFSALALVACSVLAADPSPAETVKAAARKLGNNYTWKTSVENISGRGFGGPADGKTAGGITWVSLTRRDSTVDAFLSGTNKGAIKTQEGWQSLAEATQDEGGGGPNSALWTARMVQNLQVPAEQAADLAGKVKGLEKKDDAFTGELTQEGAKSLLTLRRPGAGGQAPEVRDPKGKVTFWVKEGQLTKYQFDVQGTVSFNGNDRDVDRITTVEIKDIGTTKIDVPAEAKAKM